MTSRLNDRHCGTERSCPRCGAPEESINHLLFECPPALQCWALSPIPSQPGVFPSSSLYNNFDHLLWRAKEKGTEASILAHFPWLIWYIWKARNEKVFNGKEISHDDTLNLAENEAESWRVAQVIEEEQPEEEESRNCPPTRTNNPNRFEYKVCQVDASWCHNAQVVGFGFVTLSGNSVSHIGLCAKQNNKSPLHAELESLTWAMQKMIIHGNRPIHFQTDCAQLTRIINDGEDWPALASELEEFQVVRDLFQEFSISFIPRLENSRADCSAKGARSRGVPFEFIDKLVPQWLRGDLSSFAPE